MHQKTYENVLARLASEIPLFADQVLKKAIEELNVTTDEVTVFQLKEAIEQYIEPVIRKKLGCRKTISEFGAGIITLDKDGAVITATENAHKLYPDLETKRFQIKNDIESRIIEVNNKKIKLLTTPVFNEKNQVILGTCIVLDATFDFELDQEMARNYEQLQHSKEVIGQQVILRTKKYEELNEELGQKNIELFRNTVALTETRNQLEDRNFELEQVNIKLSSNTVALTETRNLVEDRNFELEKLNKDISEKNVVLFRNTVALTEIRNLLEDRNFELEKLNKDVSEKNIKLFKNTVELTETRNQLEDAFTELEEANVQLLGLDKAKSEFISVASHELRTPLTSLIGYIEVLLTHPQLLKDEKKTNEILKISFNEARKLHHLINDILNLSKMDAGKMDFHFKKGDVRKIIESVYNEAQILATQKGIILRRIYDRNIPMINFDKNRIEEAVSNIVNNAVKLLDKKGIVDINVTKDRGNLKIIVKDNGPGIPKGKINKLFTPFMQVESAERHHEGTGLGLAITKRIIEAHQGQIKVDSKINKGSTFTIILPSH